MDEGVTAFLIHKRDYQNNSALLDFLTDDYGLIRIVAKGIKKDKMKIQQFSKLLINFSGKSSMKSLNSWQIIDHYREISYKNLLLLTYVNEIISKIITQSPLKICDEYYYLLNHLNEDKNNNYWLLRIFENHLLKEIGYGIDYNFDINGNKITSDDYYFFINNKGFKLDKAGDIAGKSIIQFAKNIMPDEKGLKDYKKINKLRINNLLPNKKLQSRELFKAFQSI